MSRVVKGRTVWYAAAPQSRLEYDSRRTDFILHDRVVHGSGHERDRTALTAASC
jgi:hypothetical protein